MAVVVIKIIQLIVFYINNSIFIIVFGIKKGVCVFMMVILLALLNH